MEFLIQEVTDFQELGDASSYDQFPAPTKDEPLITIDGRTNVFGARFTLDPDVMAECMANLGGKMDHFRIRMCLVDKPSEGKDRGWFVQTQPPADLHEWAVLVPVSDRLEYSDKALHYINVSTLALVRRCIATHDMGAVFRRIDVVAALTQFASNVLVAESFNAAREVVDAGYYPLLPSVLPAESELLAEKEQNDGQEE